MTWHTTLLAEVGPNDEGPLPWIERDYTPISSAKDWEAGRCDILIKVYPDGACTSWRYRAAPARVWLSKLDVLCDAAAELGGATEDHRFSLIDARIGDGEHEGKN